MKHHPHYLTASLAVQLPVTLNDLPTGCNVQLFPDGEFAARDGRPATVEKSETITWRMDANIAATLIAQVQTRETPLCIDYEHHTLTAKDKGHKALAAGWIESLTYVPGQGLFAKVAWTDTARQHIQAGEYRYVSPLFSFDLATGAVQYLMNAALTNNPALDGLLAVAASQNLDTSARHSGQVALTADEREAARLLGKTEKEFQESKHLVALADASAHGGPQVAALTADEREAARLLGLTEVEYLAGKGAC